MQKFLTNRFLDSLSPANRDHLLAHATQVTLPLRTHLFRPEDPPTHAYFVTSGMVSIVTATDEGETVEVGIIGYEGLLGGLHLLGPAKVSLEAFIQLEATALRIPFTQLKKAFRDSEEIRSRVLEFQQVQSLTVSQIAGCNRLHPAEQRLARWLLMVQDRTQSDFLDFTQEFLAMMLGSRRPTVSSIAGAMQKQGLIKYSRGRVTILDTPALEAAACDCHQITKALFANLYTQPIS